MVRICLKVMNMNKKIFLSTPISGFENRAIFTLFRKKVIDITTFLEGKGFDVYSEINKTATESDYDSPVKSIKDDFQKVKSSDIFIMLHPQKMQTSTFIELGYACAFNVKIIIIGDKNNLPYLAKGLEESEFRAKLMHISDFNNINNEEIFDAIFSML